jgi:hypothetical protein
MLRSAPRYFKTDPYESATPTALCASRLGVAQVAPATVLEVQAENFVAYVGDVSDISKFATEPGVTTVSPMFAVRTPDRRNT